jgi:hypothetical protein
MTHFIWKYEKHTILKYWARKAKFHDISQYLADHVSCRVTHVAHHTFVFTN